MICILNFSSGVEYDHDSEANKKNENGKVKFIQEKKKNTKST